MLVKLGTGRFYPPILSSPNPLEMKKERFIEAVLRDFSDWFNNLPPSDYTQAKEKGYYPVNISLWSKYCQAPNLAGFWDEVEKGMKLFTEK